MRRVTPREQWLAAGYSTWSLVMCRVDSVDYALGFLSLLGFPNCLRAATSLHVPIMQALGNSLPTPIYRGFNCPNAEDKTGLRPRDKTAQIL